MIVVDIEASGIDPAKHSLLSIGALELESPTNHFYGECKVWDGADIMDDALEVNGFTREEITDPTKQSLEILMISFLEWAQSCNEHTLAGHAFAFDWYFLRTSAERYHLDWRLPKRTIDTHSLAYMHMVKQGIKPPIEKARSAISLRYIREYVGIPEILHAHNAMDDAKYTAEIISRLLYDRSLLEDFKEYPLPWMNR